MVKNYLKITFRNLLTNKTSSVINIGGLSIGMAVALLIGLWVWEELSFNHCHPNHGKIAQVMDVETVNGQRNTGELVALPLAEELRNKYASDFKYVSLVFPNFTHTVAIGEKKLAQSGEWVQPDFPEMLSLTMIRGRWDALKDPSAVMLSQSLSKALFGYKDPMNQILKIDNMTNVRVGGVYEDLPLNSSFHDTKLFLSWDKALTVMNWLKDNQSKWDAPSVTMMVQLNDPVDLEKVNKKISGIVNRHLKSTNQELLLFPMDKWHLYGEFKNGKIAGGFIRYVWMFGIIGVFVLMLACINFMNLSTARSSKRAKEVGIRKAIGSLRGQLIWQFLSESLVMSFLAFILSLVWIILSLPYFNILTGREISLPIGSLWFLLSTLLFVIAVGLLAGSYPAFYLSGFNTIKVLKGTFRAGRLASLPRKALVVVQFTVSITLIIGTVIVYKQIQYAKNRPAGYNKAGLVSVTMNTPESYDAPYNALRADLIETGAVVDMAKSLTPSTESPAEERDINWKGKDPHTTPIWGDEIVTHDFGHTIGWQLKQGRDFSRTFATDTGSIILNEAAAKIIGFKNPVGESIWFEGKNHNIIGVVKDMIMESPYSSITPTIFVLGNSKDFYGALTIRLRPGLPTQESMQRIEKVFKKYNPGGAFEYKFIDEGYAHKFADEVRISYLSTCFASLAVFISCLGLFGLVSFVVEQRTKELGIRKVLGASVFSLWNLLSKEFAILVIISILLSTPIAYYFMHSWLQAYEYRTTLSAWVFMSAGFAALIITVVVVSLQTLKASIANPVKNLRVE
jgi:putative ABC transport system permease protein